MIEYIGYAMLAKGALEMWGNYQSSTKSEALMRKQAQLNRKYGDRKLQFANMQAEEVLLAAEETARYMEWEGGYKITTQRDKGERAVRDIVSSSGSSGAVVGYGSPRRVAMAQALVNKFALDQMNQSLSIKTATARNNASRNAQMIIKQGEMERDYYYDLGGMANRSANNMANARNLTLLTGAVSTGSQMMWMDYSSRVNTGAGGNPSGTGAKGMSMFNWMYS